MNLFREFVFALVPILSALFWTFIVSRLLLWPLKKWDGGIDKLAIANGGSLAIHTILGGIGMADGGPFAWGAAFVTYGPPQVLWFVFDVVRLKWKGYKRRK